MKKCISKVLIVAMVFSVLCFYPAKQSGSVKVQADEGETTGQVVTTTTTAPETTTQQETTVPTTTKAKKKTPAKVTNLKVSDVKNSSLKVSWKKAKNATEYWVFRSKEKKGKVPAFKSKPYKTMKKLSFIDTGLEQGTVYKYKVVAYRKANGYTTKSAGVTVTAMTDIDPVKSFKAKAGKHCIKLTYKKNAKATKYYLYRAAEKSVGYTKYKKIKTLSKKKTSYTDKNVSSGRVYKYKIVAFRKKLGKKSTSLGKTASAMTSLSSPSKLRSTEKATKITLKWNQVNNAEKYEVYKGDKLVKVTTKLKYTQKGLKKRHTYNFKVRAVRRFKGKTYKSAFSEITASTNLGRKGSWIEICIKTQTLRMYINNKLYVKTPVVTGNVGDRHTSKGDHSVIEKTAHRQLKGSYHGQSWDVTVNYWLKFTSDAQGIHDSTWRSAYGGNIYKTNGSHGCVNTPLGAMRKIFKKARVGMPVIVY